MPEIIQSDSTRTVIGVEKSVVYNLTTDLASIIDFEKELFDYIGLPAYENPADVRSQSKTDVLAAQANNVALDDQLSRVQNTSQIGANNSSSLPLPKAYVVAASFTISPESLIGLPQLNLPTGTKILIAGLASVDKINQGNIGEALQEARLFISIILPGQTESLVVTYRLSTGDYEVGKGTSKPFNIGGVVNGALFANYRIQPGAVTSANAGVLIGSPQLSKALSGTFSTAIRGSGRALAAALAASGIGIGGTLPTAVTAELLARVANTGNYFIGAGYQGSLTTDGKSISLETPAGRVTYKTDDFIKKAISEFTWDNRNYGYTEIAYTKLQWQLANGSSYFQLSPASGGWSAIDPNTNRIVEEPYKNQGDAGLSIINYINEWGHSVAQPEGSGATSPLTYKDRPPPANADGSTPRFYVREYENVESGAEAMAVVAHLKKTLSPNQWNTFVAGLKPLAEPLGFNFGLSELNSKAPTDKTLSQVRKYLLRDWNKDSNPDTTRTIREIPGARQFTSQNLE